MSQNTDYKICKYCEHVRYPAAYMSDCTKHKRVTFFDSVCHDWCREVGSDDTLGEGDGV